MKALTITQPWATLIAIGAKRFETRSWSTAHRGALAIHAGKGLGPVGGMRGLRALCATEPFREVLCEADYADPADLPRGVVVATAKLVDVVDVADAERSHLEARALGVVRAPHELAFGDYSLGRFAWAIRDVQPYLTGPVRGALGIWEWER